MQWEARQGTAVFQFVKGIGDRNNNNNNSLPAVKPKAELTRKFAQAAEPDVGCSTVEWLLKIS